MTSPPESPSPSKWPILVILPVLCGYLLVSCHRVHRTTSITFDETFYLNCGLQSVHDGWLDSRLAAEGVAPLPILIDYIPPLLFQPREARPEMWTGNPSDRELIDGPRRFNGWLIAVPMIVVGFLWLYRRQGLLVASCGAAVLVGSPTLTAHAALATTDSSITLFGFVGMLAVAWFVQSPSWKRLTGLALALAAALSAKYSAVFLLPVAGLMFFLTILETRLSGDQKPGKAIRSAFGWSIGRYVVLWLMLIPLWWGFHFFSFTGPLKSVPLAETPDDSPWVKILGRGPTADEIMDRAHREWKRPAPFAGVLFQYLHNQGGHRSFLMGERHQTGWWYYFPCAFAFKSTPVELLLTGGLIGLVVMSMAHPVRNWRSLDRDRQTMLLSAAVMLALVLTANINIGQRYLIVLYPLLILVSFDRLGASLARRTKVLATVCGTLVAGQFLSHAAIGPHYLAYFNQLSGGPQNGWRLLVDSNIDWGQDLPALQQELERLKPERAALQYFGTAIPESYGVDAERVHELTSAPDDYDLLAISVSCLQGMYVGPDDPFQAFRDLPPDGLAGYSIRLYRLNTPERKAAFRESAAMIQAAMEQAAQSKTREPDSSLGPDGRLR